MKIHTVAGGDKSLPYQYPSDFVNVHKPSPKKNKSAEEAARCILNSNHLFANLLPQWLGEPLDTLLR
jgi:hypothetical protein